MAYFFILFANLLKYYARWKPGNNIHTPYYDFMVFYSYLKTKMAVIQF